MQQVVEDFCTFKENSRVSPFTLISYRSSINDYVAFCGTNLLDLNIESAQKYLMEKSNDVGENTLRTLYKRLQVFLMWHLQLEAKPRIPFTLKPETFSDVANLDYQNIRMLLEEARRKYQDTDYIFLRAAVATCARRKELLALRKEDLYVRKEADENGEMVDYYIVNVNAKIAKSVPREIVIDKVTWNILKNFQYSSSTFKFIEKQEKGEIDTERIFPFCLSTANRIFQRNMISQTRGCNIHSFRRSIASFEANHAEAGGSDDFLLEYVLGHATRRSNVANRYRLSKPDYARLWRWYLDFNPILVMNL